MFYLNVVICLEPDPPILDNRKTKAKGLTITVVWSPPNELNGELLTYEAVINREHVMVASKNTTGLVCEFTEGLEYSTEYEVAVRAITRSDAEGNGGGFGAFSTGKLVTTGAKRAFISLTFLA